MKIKFKRNEMLSVTMKARIKSVMFERKKKERKGQDAFLLKYHSFLLNMKILNEP